MKQLVLGILAHVDAGKTTLSEAMLLPRGRAPRRSGAWTTATRSSTPHALERARGITIFSKQAELSLRRHGGHAARHAGPRGLFRRDGAHAAGARLRGARHQRHGRRAGAHGNALAAAARATRVPTFLFVNKMDLAGADARPACCSELRARPRAAACVDFTATPSTDARSLPCATRRLLEQYLEHRHGAGRGRCARSSASVSSSRAFSARR